MRSDKIELLAPAGSPASLKAALAAGADAVYMGGKKFGARAYAENPETEELGDLIDYCHLHGARLYLTVNTLTKEREMESELYAYIAPLYQRGLDAVLIQDLGVFSFLKENFPDMELHISTQMTVSSAWGARRAIEMGASRLVLPRELSLKEIRQIRSECDIELEVFVHGALCYCTSGQCLMSSMIGGRSGNRGRCAQTCRLPFNGSNLLNMKDLNTLDILPDIVDAGVSSLKIEGRMKGPRYAAGVVSVYRKYLDQILAGVQKDRYHVDPADKELLRQLFDRGGCTEGYYLQHNGPSMIFTGEKPKMRLVDEGRMAAIDAEYVDKEKQEPACGSCKFLAGQPVSLTLESRGQSVTVTGQEVMAAKNRPMDADAVTEKLSKTGGSGFYMKELKALTDGNSFLPVGAINKLRRDALEELARKIMTREHRELKVPAADPPVISSRSRKNGRREIRVSIEDMRHLPEILKVDAVGRIYLPMDRLSPDQYKSAADSIRKAGKEAYLALPYTFRQNTASFMDKNMDKLKEAGFDGFLIRSIDAAGYIAESGLEGRRVFDAGMYVWNHRAEQAMEHLGADQLTFPYELKAREWESISWDKAELVVSGRIPLMVSSQCTAKTCGKCRKTLGLSQEELYESCAFRTLKDRRNAGFREDSRCRFCYTVIYNSVTLWLADRIPEACQAVRFAFTDEPVGEAAPLLSAFAAGKLLPPADYTRGHFTRGVE